MGLLWLLLLCVVAGGRATGESGDQPVPTSKWLAQGSSSNATISGKYSTGDFLLSWVISQSTYIRFTMTKVTSGYVAIGFSDRAARMGPADAYAGWVDGSGQAYAVDFSTNSDQTINDPDPQQDVTNVTGSRDGSGRLSVSFSRRLDTQDAQDRVIGSGNMNVIFCWHPTAPTLLQGGRKLNIVQHLDYGTTTINFFATVSAPSTPSTPTTTVNGVPLQTAGFCNGKFCLTWYLGGASIGFKMDIQARGYVSIGFADSTGVMGPADAYAGWVDSNSNVNVIDFSTTGQHDINAPDSIQNVANVSGSFTNGVLSITFYRALNTNDPQDKTIAPGTMHVIWCWSNAVPFGSTIPRHASGDVGFADVNFFTGGVSFNNDLQLWIPVASVAAFVALLLLPGLLGKLLGPGFAERLESILSFRPFPPRGRQWYDALTVDILYTARDMQLGDFLIVALWLPAVLLMLLSPQGNGLGRVCAAAFGTLLLPVTRYSVWAALLGSSFERYLKFHRWAARSTLVIILAHLIVQCLDKGSNVLTANANDSGFGWVFGLIAFIIMGFMSLFAYEPIRRRFFELFYYTHFLAFPAIVLAMMHSYAVCYAMAPSLAMYLIDKAIQCQALSNKYQILRASPVAGAVRLVVEGPQPKRLRCTPGQYYFAIIPAVSHLQMHPFTVAAVSPESNDLTFLIRNMGPGTFSNRVCDLASSSSPSYVRLSGPHGSLSLPKPLLDYRVVYLVAGGVGVTPMVSVVQSLLQTAPGRLKVIFIWVSRQASAFNEWFPAILVQMLTSQLFEVHLYATEDALEKHAAVELVVRSDTYVKAGDDSPLSPGSPAQSVGDVDVARLGPSIVAGRPDWTALFAPNSASGSDVAVLTCGPAPLMADVQRVAHTHRFRFHKETFAL